MEYLGNNELLNLPKVGFLASSKIPAEEVMHCYDWAVEMAKGKQCVVSGFSSPLERDVLHFLLKGTCPIIIALARRKYKVLPKEWQIAIDEGRMLIISTCNTSRQSHQTAQSRNLYIAEICDSLFFVGVSNHSSLYQLKQTFLFKCR